MEVLALGGEETERGFPGLPRRLNSTLTEKTFKLRRAEEEVRTLRSGASGRLAVNHTGFTAFVYSRLGPS